ncbi:hypothetical protein [Streptacidiphilus rugosus]|uniref:hypothetical protein n=1 Tax=Streptacidiphilus rugosus TaxID=405783 RepID=UPI000565A1A5|nr:hypothetical protein [Streptacidiphilus rugosus]
MSSSKKNAKKDVPGAAWKWHDWELLQQHVQAAYGDLTAPRRAFVSKALHRQPYLDLIGVLSRYETVSDETDTNSDVSFNYLVGDGDPLFLRLSMVGRYAMLQADLDTPTPHVIEPGAKAADGRIQAVLRALSQGGLELLSSEQLSARVELQLPDVADVRVYNALFAPEDDLPHPWTESA